MKQKDNLFFSIRSSQLDSEQFLACSQEMELLLNQFILLPNYSQKLKKLTFSFVTTSIILPKCIAPTYINQDLQLSIKLPIDHPYLFDLDEDTLKQLMVETFLEAIFVVKNYDKNVDEAQLYNDIKNVFYRHGWLTRVIFPALT